MTRTLTKEGDNTKKLELISKVNQITDLDKNFFTVVLLYSSHKLIQQVVIFLKC